MSSNLPPGCNCDDGITNPALEAALEGLCDEIATPEEAAALKAMLPGLREAMKISHAEGRREASFDAGHAREIADLDASGAAAGRFPK